MSRAREPGNRRNDTGAARHADEKESLSLPDP
ncbi:MAG: hypothetical protein JWQ99_1916, partial [Blastococcus sp.]|nr:hypothetical protein [Blastococcus sp.]